LPTDIADHVGHDDQQWFVNSHTVRSNQTPVLSREGKGWLKVLYRSEEGPFVKENGSGLPFYTHDWSILFPILQQP